MSLYTDTLESLDKKSNRRSIPADNIRDDIIDFSGNDYLGIAADRELYAEFIDTIGDCVPPLSASASRLLASRQKEFNRLESLLEDLYGAPVLLFNSGYHANSGAIAALAANDTLIVADKLVHASIIDGIILSRAPFQRFKHNDLDHLQHILANHASKHSRVLLVVESVYSMDGDMAPINDIIALKKQYPNVELYVDEAHSFGVMGPNGLGVTANMPDVEFTLLTFGKACGSEGAALVCRPTSSRDYLINTCRSLIFSTAIPPLNCAWSRFVIEKIPGMDKRRDNLKKLSSMLGTTLHIESPTHIQPLIIGSSHKAIQYSNKLLDDGFKVLPIRTPTVPAGTERLRFSLSANMKSKDIERLKKSLEKLK